MLLVTFLMLVAAPMETAGSPDPAPTAEPKKAKPRRICRETERSGSHMTLRICRTAEEWSELSSKTFDQPFNMPGNRAATGRNINTGTKPRDM